MLLIGLEKELLLLKLASALENISSVFSQSSASQYRPQMSMCGGVDQIRFWLKVSSKVILL